LKTPTKLTVERLSTDCPSHQLSFYGETNQILIDKIRNQVNATSRNVITLDANKWRKSKQKQCCAHESVKPYQRVFQIHFSGTWTQVPPPPFFL